MYKEAGFHRLVYLAGPVSFLSGKEAVSWRDYTSLKLNSTRFHCLSPLRGKESILGDSVIFPTGYAGNASDHVLYRTCKWDVKRCDIFLANLIGSERVSIGTCFELAWAEDAGKMVVVCIEEGNPHHHAFPLQSSSIMFSNLEEGINYIKDVL